MDTNLGVCTIGGGTGMPVVNLALVKAGFKNIYSIVSTFDSGGDTGRMRTDERGKILAFSDYWRSLISLWQDGEQKIIWQEMLGYRDGRGRNFGNTFFQFMAEKTGNISLVDSLFSKLTQAKLIGQVVPVSLEPGDLCFKTKSGREFIGEHHLDDMRMSADIVEKIWLSKKIEANPEALESIKKSEVIIVCPGSMYGSVLINFLPKGIKEAFVESKAKKILMVNIVSTANENHNFDQDEYSRVFESYTGVEFDQIIMVDLKKLDKPMLDKAIKMYELERSWPIKYNPGGKKKVDLVDMATIDEKNLRLRHSEDKLEKYFARMELCPKSE